MLLAILLIIIIAIIGLFVYILYKEIEFQKKMKIILISENYHEVEIFLVHNMASLSGEDYVKLVAKLKELRDF